MTDIHTRPDHRRRARACQSRKSPRSKWLGWAGDLSDPRVLRHRDGLSLRLHVLHLAQGLLRRLHVPTGSSRMSLRRSSSTASNSHSSRSSQMAEVSGRWCSSNPVWTPASSQTQAIWRRRSPCRSSSPSTPGKRCGDGEDLPIYTVSFEAESDDLVLVRATTVGSSSIPMIRAWRFCGRPHR